MHKLNAVPLFAVLAALLAFAGLICANALSAELEGALQYPPREIGEDAQPPPPAMVVPPLVSPWRIELGVSGSSAPPNTQHFLIRPLIRRDRSGAPSPTGSGGG
jgi:hypothetical protein